MEPTDKAILGMVSESPDLPLMRRQRHLQGVSKNERLTRRFPGARFRGQNPTETVLFCCLTKLCIIPPSVTVKKKTARRSSTTPPPSKSAPRKPSETFLASI